MNRKGMRIFNLEMTFNKCNLEKTLIQTTIKMIVMARYISLNIKNGNTRIKGIKNRMIG